MQRLSRLLQAISLNAGFYADTQTESDAMRGSRTHPDSVRLFVNRPVTGPGEELVTNQSEQLAQRTAVSSSTPGLQPWDAAP